MTKTDIIKKRYPFYDEDIAMKDIEINAEAVKELMQEYADSEVKKISLNLSVIGELVCPFCMQGEFDRIGLKNHLLNYCDEFGQTNFL